MTVTPLAKRVACFISLMVMTSRVNTLCENPLPLVNGKWTSYFMKDKLEVGARWEYSCYSGYSLVGSATVKCNSDNQWSSPVPTCVRGIAQANVNSASLTTQKCSSPRQIFNGRWTATFMRDKLEVGAVWKFTCYTGFTLVGSASSSCAQNGQWTSEAPTCERAALVPAPVTLFSPSNKCPSPRQIYNGKWTATFMRDKLEIGAVWKYSCYNRYTLIGPPSISCNPNGQWTSEVPTCQLGSTSAVTAVDSALVPRVNLRCPNPQLIMNGRWTATFMTDKLEIGAKWEFTCYTGYTLDGSITMTCNASGQWSSEVPKCGKDVNVGNHPTTTPPPGARMSCTYLRLPAFMTGTYSYNSQPMEIGTKLTLECTNGYELLGNAELTCASNGQWSGRLPQCVFTVSSTTVATVVAIASCKDPGVPPNSRRLASYIIHFLEIGATIYFTCNEGFVLNGDDTITCNSNGKWSSAIPTCDISTPLPTTKPLSTSCIDPGIPEKAQRSASYVVNFLEIGAVILYTCNKGYTLKGDDKITCNSDGTWSSTVPRCVSATKTGCSLPPKPSHGKIQYITSVPRATIQLYDKIQYICDSSYHLAGPEERICLSDGEWSGVEPRCIRDCGRSKSSTVPYVINGQDSTEGQWPWQAAIARDEKLLLERKLVAPNMVTVTGGDSKAIYCGGSLINEEWVLTAAHCVTRDRSNEQLPIEAISVFLGKQYRDQAKDDIYVQWSKTADITVHEQYTYEVFKADIAMVRLEIKATFNERVVPVCLPSSYPERESPVENRGKGIVSGWGVTEEKTPSGTLKYGVIEYVPPSVCEKVDPGQPPASSGKVQEDQFCAKAISVESGWTCHGDSGSPVVYIEGTKWVIEGIVSWGHKDCVEGTSVYIRVKYYIPWMNTFVDVREYSG